jgi:4-hydroxy-tetrahydrodipicolinate reductase
MKIALLGKGKTGSKVLDVASDVEVFDSKNVPTFEKLMKADVVISFLPGDAFLGLIPLLLETRKPVVTGSTGFTWPSNFNRTLQEKNLTWIYATNFSLGVVIMKQMIQKLHQMTHLFSEKKLSIHEVHHTKKLDAPSGTALSMKEWLQEEVEVTSERTGDVVGIHTLTLESPSEIISLTHDAKNRTLFAEGAVWAARHLVTHKNETGLLPFQQVVERQLIP